MTFEHACQNGIRLIIGFDFKTDKLLNTYKHYLIDEKIELEEWLV